METTHRFRTFHVLNKEQEEIGRITAVKKQEEDGRYLVAFAFCSPKDRYHKKFGQMVALGRLAHKPKKRYVTYNGSVEELKEMALAVASMKGIGWIEKEKEVILV
jgi:hypothetical protein